MRKCEDCSLCCKLPEINYFKEKKQSFSWCKECNISVGCKIYDERPKGCKDFTCAYVEKFTDLKPNKVGFIIFPQGKLSMQHKVLTVYCEEFKLSNFIKHIKKIRRCRTWSIKVGRFIFVTTKMMISWLFTIQMLLMIN